MDEQLKRVIETIRGRMIDLYTRYSAEMDDAQDNRDVAYADGTLDTYWEIDEMLNEVFSKEEGEE